MSIELHYVMYNGRKCLLVLLGNVMCLFYDDGTFAARCDSYDLDGKIVTVNGEQIPFVSYIDGSQGLLTIQKVYSSIEEMNSGYETDGVTLNGLVIISTNDINDEDNSKLFIKTSTEYSFLTDLSGSQGIQGPKGDKGEAGPIGPQGPKGDKGDSGVTPIKGVDYFTDSEISEIENKASQNTALVINLTENVNNGTYTADKTYSQIKQAFDNNKRLLVMVNSTSEAQLPLLIAEFANNGDAGLTFGYTEVRTNGDFIVTRSIHLSHTEDTGLDVWEEKTLSEQYLKTTGGEITGNLEVTGTLQLGNNINMGSNSILNAQKIHVDGDAPIYIGHVVETTDTNKPRLTGIVNTNEAAFVKSGSQNEYVPVRVAEPTSNDQAANKKYVDAKIAAIQTGMTEAQVKTLINGCFTYDSTTGILNITTA